MIDRDALRRWGLASAPGMVGACQSPASCNSTSPSAGYCERLRGADPERVPNRRTAVQRPSTRARPWEAVPVVQSGARPPAPPLTYAAAWSSRSRARCTWWAPWRVHWPPVRVLRPPGALANRIIPAPP